MRSNHETHCCLVEMLFDRDIDEEIELLKCEEDPGCYLHGVKRRLPAVSFHFSCFKPLNLSQQMALFDCFNVYW